jgi:hypothetical protein
VADGDGQEDKRTAIKEAKRALRRRSEVVKESPRKRAMSCPAPSKHASGNLVMRRELRDAQNAHTKRVADASKRP